MPSRVRNFFISFVIAAIMFSSVAVIAVGIIDRNILNPDPEITAENTVADTASPETDIKGDDDPSLGNGKTFSFLLMGIDYLPDFYDYSEPPANELAPTKVKCADAIVFGMFNKQKKEFVITPIHPDTLILVDGVEMPISKAYGYKDELYIRDKVATMLGMSIDYYASVTISDFVSIVDVLGGVDYELSQDIKYVNEIEEIDVELKKGKHHLSGKELSALLRYDGYNNRLGRSSTLADVIITVLRNFTNDLLNKYKYESQFNSVKDLINTNVTLKDLAGNIDLIFRFSSMKISYINYPGKWSEKGFTPNIDQGVEVFSAYKNS